MGEIASFLHQMLPGCLLALVLWVLVLPLRLGRLRRLGLGSSPARECLLVAFAAYCGGMAVLTLTPPDFALASVLRGTREEPFFHPGSVNLELFKTLRYSKVTLAGNFVMFLPFGFLHAVLWRGGGWLRALAVAVCVTGGIECWQLLVGRTFDVDDLLFNAVGSLLGFLLWLLLKKPTLTCEER